MAKPAWHIAVPGIIIVFAGCSEASATYVDDRYFISTLVTIVPTPADFLNFPHYVALPETTTGTREYDFLVTYSKLITKDWALFSRRPSASSMRRTAARFRASKIWCSAPSISSIPFPNTSSS